MTRHRIIYEGPPSLAVPTATRLADADGVELTASEPPQRQEAGGTVRLALVLEGDTDTILDAVAAARNDLPAGATLTIDGAA